MPRFPLEATLRAHTLCTAGLLLLLTFCAVPHVEPDAAAGEPVPPRRRMAVTVDDLPVSPPGAHTTDEQRTITTKLLRTLANERVPAVGFVNESKLEVDGRVDPDRVALLEQWIAAGMELGNHTYSHPDLHRVSLEEFERDVLRGERVTRPLLMRAGLELRWFRHPFLHTGRDLDTKHELERFLREHGYRVAPVTIDNSEWVYGGAYARAFRAGDRDLMRRLADSYVGYMDDVVRFYEGQSRAIVGEEIPQVLLVHAYLLNAEHLDRVLAAIRGRGYDFVTLDEALRHPAYGMTDTFTGPGGITWLHRWAISRGMPGSTFAGEPEVPSWVDEAARARSVPTRGTAVAGQSGLHAETRQDPAVEHEPAAEYQRQGEQAPDVLGHQ